MRWYACCATPPASGSDEDRQRTRGADFDAHLVKPIDLQELLMQIKRVAGNR